jgi:hypothetical protein
MECRTLSRTGTEFRAQPMVLRSSRLAQRINSGCYASIPFHLETTLRTKFYVAACNLAEFATLLPLHECRRNYELRRHGLPWYVSRGIKLRNVALPCGLHTFDFVAFHADGPLFCIRSLLPAAKLSQSIICRKRLWVIAFN